jgi:hypothetical protein
VQELPDDIDTEQAILQSQPTEEDVPIDVHQPNASSLADNGIKVIDFAYTGPLPYIRKPRPLGPKQDSGFLKRGRTTDAFSLPVLSNLPENKESSSKRQKLVHTYALTTKSGFDDEDSVIKGYSSLMAHIRPRHALDVSTPPRSQPALDSCDNTEASQESENLVPTPVVTPQGSMYWPIHLLPQNPDSQTYAVDEMRPISYSQLDLSAPRFLQSQSQQSSQNQDPFASAPELGTLFATNALRPFALPTKHASLGNIISPLEHQELVRPCSRRSKRPSPYPFDTPTKRSRSWSTSGTLMHLRSREEVRHSSPFSGSNHASPEPEHRDPPQLICDPSGPGSSIGSDRISSSPPVPPLTSP